MIVTVNLSHRAATCSAVTPSRIDRRYARNSSLTLGENTFAASAGLISIGTFNTSDRQPLSINIASQ